MTFATLTFLIFLAIVFGVHWRARTRVGQNVTLLVASYVFYGWWDPRFCALLAASSVADFVLARALGHTPTGAARRRRLLVWASVALNLGLLGIFKYYDFFLEGFAAGLESLGFQAHLPSLRVVLPVGISFYTFQTLGYTVDVFRGRVQPSRSLLDYLTYVSFFPQLVAGPIERAGRLLPQLARKRTFDERLARDGAKQMLWGACKKVIVADHLGIFVEQVYGDAQMHASGPVYLVATACFAIQIYCDFSGYSDIAIGTAKLLGVNLTRNFATPYFSQSAGEFWRRWHISLSTWFRDYVYIPLGGRREGPVRRGGSIMATFTLSGLWHGANWTFVVWGVLNGLYVLVEGVVGNRSRRRGPDDPLPSLGERAGLSALTRMLATFAVIGATWVFFRAESLGHAWSILGRIGGDSVGASGWTQLQSHGEFLSAFGPLVGVLLVVEWVTHGQAHPLSLPRWPRPLRWLLYTALLWAILFLMPDDPTAFIYFQF